MLCCRWLQILVAKVHIQYITNTSNYSSILHAPFSRMIQPKTILRCQPTCANTDVLYVSSKLSTLMNCVTCRVNLASYPCSPSSASVYNMTFDHVKIDEGEPGRFLDGNDECDVMFSVMVDTFFYVIQRSTRKGHGTERLGLERCSKSGLPL